MNHSLKEEEIKSMSTSGLVGEESDDVGLERGMMVLVGEMARRREDRGLEMKVLHRRSFRGMAWRGTRRASGEEDSGARREREIDVCVWVSLSLSLSLAGLSCLAA